jgi:hypothetical protein
MLLATLAQGFCAMQFSAIDRSLPHLAELRGDVGVTIATLKSNRLGAQSVAVRATVLFDGRETTVPVVYITPRLGEVLPLRLLSGAMPSEDGRAVLPESTANFLFPDTVPEDNAITVGGKTYPVSGVCADRALPAVFIADLSADAPVSSIFLVQRKGEESEPAELHLQRAQESLQLPLGGELCDYRELIGLARSLWYLSVVLCALMALILILAFAARLSFAALLARGGRFRNRVRLAILAAILTAAALICFSILLRGFRIPGAFLPPDNIFDFAFYGAEIAGFFARARAYAYEALFLARIVPLAATGVVSVASFCVGAVLIYRRMRLRSTADG